MKLKFVAHMMLIDYGRASKTTRGAFNGALTEVGSPPYNKWA
jgi:hypothetical protein